MKRLLKVGIAIITIILIVVACNLKPEINEASQQSNANFGQDPTIRIGFEVDTLTQEIRYLTPELNGVSTQATEVLAGPSTTGFTFSYGFAGGNYLPSGTTNDTGTCQPNTPDFEPTTNTLTVEFCFENQSATPYQKLLYRTAAGNTNVVSATHDGKTLDSTNFVPSAAAFDNTNDGTLVQNEATQAQIFVINYTGTSVRFFLDVLASHLVINEVDVSTANGNLTVNGNAVDATEFVEIYDGGVGNTSLTGHVLNFFDGTSDTSYRSVDLVGKSTNVDGYAVICVNSDFVANCDFDISGAGQAIDELQDGADAIGLYFAAPIANGTALTNNNLLDAFVYDTDDVDDAGLLTLLNTGQQQMNENGGGNEVNQSNSRCINGSGGAQNTTSYLQRAPTPGVANDCPDGSFDIELRFVNAPTASQATAFAAAEARWESIVTGDVANQFVNIAAAGCGAGMPAVNETIDDLLILIQLGPIDGVGNVLGSAGPCATRVGTHLVAIGTMNFDTADLGALETAGTLNAVIAHEMGHVLGIGSRWEPANLHGTCPGAIDGNVFYTGANAVAQFTGAVPAGLGQIGQPLVEETGGPGTSCGHWDEGFFDNELMTGFLDAGSNPISSMTIGSIADLGHTVDLAQAEAYTVPGCSIGLGCTNVRGGQSEMKINDIILSPQFEVLPDGTLIPTNN